MSDQQKILFMGTPDFARVILQELLDVGLNVVGVVAQPDQPVGRGQKLQSPPVALLAKEKGLPLFQPETLRHRENVDALMALSPDYIVVAAYGKILPEAILSLAKKDILNVHASLLPKYRGASPVTQAILQGDKLTGVSIMRIEKELDAGPVYHKQELPIEFSDTTETLMAKLSVLGAKALLHTLALLEKQTYDPQKQNDLEATHCKKITKEISPIDWAWTAEKIDCHIRGLQPWPVATSTLSGQKIKIYRAILLSGKSGKEPGTVVSINKKGWTVTTGSGDMLIEEVQLEGKKRLPAFDVANGLRLTAGFELGR